MLIDELGSAIPTCMIGSGISTDAPACLPLAQPIRNHVAAAIAPADATPDEIDAVRELAPERLFEILLSAFEYTLAPDRARQLIVEPWLVLDGAYLERHGSQRPRFTVGHSLLVYFGWKRGTPIVTTNFDPLLEEAAYAIGLAPHVEAGDDARLWREHRRNSKEVIIWKPHGTIDRPDTVRATIERTGVLRPDVLLRLEQVFRSTTTLVTGYSGRDLDVFPSLRASLQTLWLTREERDEDVFGYQRLRESGQVAQRFKGTLNDFAIGYAQHVLPQTCPVADRIRAQIPKNPLSMEFQNERLGNYLSVCHRIATSGAWMTMGEPAAREFIWGFLLLRAYRFRAAAMRLERYIAHSSEDSPQSCRARLLLAVAYDGQSKYCQMYECASEASRMVASKRNPALAAQALNLTSRALVMQHLRPRDWRSGGYTTLQALRLFRAACVRAGATIRLTIRVSVPRVGDSCAERDGYAARLEAQLQMATIFLRLAVWNGMRPVVNLVSWTVRKIAEASLANGMADIASAAYHELIAVGIERDRFLDQVVRDYLSDRLLHQTLLAIDTAVGLLHKGSRDTAVSMLESARKSANDMGTGITEIKARLILRQAGVKIRPGEADACFDEIEADGYASSRADILQFLEN